MSDVIWWKYFAWLALFASPAVPMMIAWILLSKLKRTPGMVASVAVSLLSLVWFVAATMNFSFAGPLYGLLHYAIAAGNLIAMLVCSVFCIFVSVRSGPRAATLLMALGNLMLAMEWTWLGIAYR
jgi:hypothetical protein